MFGRRHQTRKKIRFCTVGGQTPGTIAVVNHGPTVRRVNKGYCYLRHEAEAQLEEAVCAFVLQTLVARLLPQVVDAAPAHAPRAVVVCEPGASKNTQC